MAPLTDSLNEDSSALASDAERLAVREDVASLLAGAGTQLLSGADELNTPADSTLVDQLSYAVKSAVAATSELSNVSADSGTDSLLALMRSRKAAGVSEGSKQNIIEATSSLLTGTLIEVGLVMRLMLRELTSCLR